jgi:elongation factor G
MSQEGLPNGSRIRESGARTVALMGPYLSGKTSLLEALAQATGAVTRKSTVLQGHMLGDSSPEARAHHMSTEVNVAQLVNQGETLTILDCPGSIEFLQESLSVMPGIDAAVVVCEPDPAKVLQLMPYLKRLSDLRIPTFLFVNKIELASANLRQLLDALQGVCMRPLVLRQLPVFEGGLVTGYVDLALERAYAYRDHGASTVIPMKPALREAEKAARFRMLEQLADYDDHLMEELVGDVDPPQAEICADLAREVSQGQIVPVLLGSAERDHGIQRLLKALRHDVPGPMESAKRLGIKAAKGEAVLRVLKTVHTAHGGKLSLARVIAGTIKDGATVHASGGRSARIGGLFSQRGAALNKIAEAGAGETVALGRLDAIGTGDVITTDKAGPPALGRPEMLFPVYGLAVAVDDAREDVKLTGGLAKLAEEDLSIRYEQNADTHELVLWGQGEVHLRVAAEKLASRYGLHITTRAPKVPYKESIRKGLVQRGRHKRQTGGHGQFGDVVLDIKPLPRGAGFVFTEEISGGVVPRQYFSAVEAGVRDYLSNGPLGFPVVDLAVSLIDGSYHAVDSSEMAFRTAGRIAMSEAMGHCGPVLLEPIMVVAIDVPGDATARVNAIVSARRGQILGFDACEGWPGWDQVRTEIPLAELSGLIVELRSASQGVARLSFAFDHLAELTGKLADDAMARANAA